MTAPQLYLRQFELGPMENFVYLVGDKKTGECLIVDPAWDVESVIQAAAEDGMKVIGGLATHTHFDHINGLEDLMRVPDTKIYIHKEEADPFKKFKDRVVKTEEGLNLSIGGLKIAFLHTPGHSPGGQCFLVAGRLFSGDTLFINACGRSDLAGGSVEMLYASLQRLARLDDEVIVLPGHDYGEKPTSTIGGEKRNNPYYQCRSFDEFLSARMG